MTGQVLVVDSSVAVKWFKRDGETGVESALQLLADHRDTLIELAAPTHLKLEVLNALWASRLDEANLALAARDLDGLRIAWREPDAELTAHAASIAAQYRLTLYDAVFVALARELDTELVTLDGAIIESRACRVRVP